jgi:spermidine synthase
MATIESAFWKLANLNKLDIIKKMETSNDPYYNKMNKYYIYYFNELSKVLNDENIENINKVIQCGKNVVLKLINNKEYIDDGYFSKHFKIIKNLFTEKSIYQTIQIFQTEYYGKILVIDDDIQLAEKDEFIYHEMFVHVPMNLLNNPKNVLIIGGGDGGVTRELLKYKDIIITQVEIDKLVIDACYQFFPEMASSMKNPRVNLIIDDASKWIETNNIKYDLIIMDTTDFNASNPLFDNSFFIKLKNILTEKSILVFNGVNLNWSSDMAYNLLEQQSLFFKYTRLYQCYLPMYGDGHFCFVISSNYMDPLYWIPKYNNEINTNYYNLEIHHASFQLPTYLKKMLYNENNNTYYFGYHVTIEMNGVPFDILNSEKQLLDILKDTCVNVGKLIVKNEGFYKFNPQGVTAYIILSTSHASIHTWPELGKCAIDIFTCKLNTDMSDMISYLTQLLKPKNYSINYIHRKI